MKRLNFLFIVIWGFWLGLAGCQADVPTTVPILLQFSTKNQVADLADVQRLVLEISGAGFTPMTVSRTAPFSQTVEFEVNVPAGSAREFKVTAVVGGGLFFGHPERFGYVGRVVADIATDTANVIPILLKFINFAEDPPDDEAAPGDPDLDFVAVDNEDQTTSVLDDDQVTVKLHFTAPVDTRDLLLILEFDIDNNRLTGKTTTVINNLLAAAGSPLTTLFDRGSEFYWVLQGNPSEDQTGNNPFLIELHDFQDNLVTIPSDLIPDVKANLPNTREIEFHLPRRIFDRAMGDPDYAGDVSVLVGINTLTSESGYIHITPAQFIQFFDPGDVILETEGLGSIRYDLNFRTTGL